MTASPDLLAYAADLADPGRVLTDAEKKAGIASAGLTLQALSLRGQALAAFQSERLGLTQVGGRVHVRDAGKIPAAGYYIVGRWFSADPNYYAPAVASLLLADRTVRSVPLLEAIRQVGPAAPREVGQALLERAHWMDAGRLAEPATLEILATVSPGLLLEDTWEVIEQWMPQARAAMADVLGRLPSPAQEFTTPRDALLIRLAGDGLFGVRRSAFRAFAEAEPDRYEALLASWAADGSPAATELRRRAAEGIIWVPPGGGPDRLRSLKWDPEGAVRQAFSRASDERRESEWREFHEARVLAATTPGDVVRLWRHGCALGRLGDDRTIERLTRRAKERLPANVRFWLDRVRKAVQQRWDAAVRKWPEPWFIRRGRYEVVEGAIRWADGTRTDVNAHLWLAGTELPSGLASWGGWAEVARSGGGKLLQWTLPRPGQAAVDELVVSGRHPAQILVTDSFMPDSRVVFSGSGPYPADESDRPD